MPGHEIFDQSGKREPDPKSSSKECDQCQYTEGSLPFPGYWDSVHDAQSIYSILREAVIKELWAKLWKEFKCDPPSDKDCKVRESCSAAPAYLEGGAVLGKAPDGNIRWQVYVLVGRKIRCIKEGTGKDDEPKIPPAKKPEEPPPPKKPKEKAPGGE
jgi:hypothetical protein